MTGENLGTNAATDLAAISITQALGAGARATALGLLVQPAVWIATGSRPDAADAANYGMGVLAAITGSAFASIPGIAGALVKGWADDVTAEKLEEARADEEARYRSGITPVGDYSFMASGGAIQAREIASYGGSTWLHPNGLWMFIHDANNRLVCDFQPRVATRRCAPVLPLVRSGRDQFRWREIQSG